MKLTQQYRFGFEAWGLTLFIIVMLPNVLWFAIPAPNDVLRTESVTPMIDTIGMAFQVLMVATLCCVIRKDVQPLRMSTLVWSVVACVAIYLTGWVLYYLGMAHSFVIVLLTISPCLAFILYAIDRKNLLATLCACGFTICHAMFGIINFIA